MTVHHPTRRERLRTATVAEIKDLARRLLVAGGPQAISLRAIARDMGMTAPAIYRYFPSLDALVKELAEDLYDELREAVEAARGAGGDEPLGKLADDGPGVPTVVDRAPGRVRADLRQPGARGGHVRGRVPQPGPRRRPVRRAVPRGLRRALADQPRCPPHRPSSSPRSSARTCSPTTSATGVELPVQVVYAYLSAWTRLYGLVAMEVFGHLQWAVTEVEPLFELELASFLAQLRG